MPMQFRDENKDPDKKPDKNEMLSELRALFADSETGDIEEATPEQIRDQYGQDALNMVLRVQERMDVLVGAMHEYLSARDEGKDSATALIHFTQLMQETVIRFSPMELGSIMSAGITAIAELERRHGRPKP